MNDDFASRTLIDGASYEVIVSQQGAGLEAGEGSAPGFVAADFLNVSSLANQLWTQGDLLSQYLWKQFSASDQQLLAPINSNSQLLAVLLSNFNNIVTHAWIYDYHRFAGIVLASTTTDLLARGAQGDDVARLNRLLLQDFYPQELAKLQVNSVVVPLNANSSLWWSWKAPVSGPVTVSAHSASAGSQISVFTGESSSDLVKVTSTETWAAASDLRFNVIEGMTYQIAVLGQMNPVDDLTFSLIPSGARLLNPLDGSVFASPASLQLRAQVDDMGAPVVGIEFYANDQLIGMVAQPPYFLTGTEPPGTYRLLVRAKAEQGYVGSSPPVTILVAANSTPDTPRIFAGPFSDCSYVLNALGELRVLGKVGWQFGLAATDDLLFPQLASWPEGVRKWSWIGAGSPFLFWDVPYSQRWNSVDCPSWALSELGQADISRRMEKGILSEWSQQMGRCGSRFRRRPRGRRRRSDLS